MGHTLPTITGHFENFISSLSRFRRALRKADQLEFDELWAEVRQHLPAASYAANVLPSISFLVAVALEQRKQIKRQSYEIEEVRREFRREIREITKSLEKENRG